MFRLLILADDFTGTLDTGMHFAARDIPAQIPIAKAHHFMEKDAEMLVIDTETRHLSPRGAGKIMRALTENAIHVGVSCVYKRTDSAPRDNVGAELEAALSGSGGSVLPFLPAFPELGRITVGGHQCINRIPVNGSPFDKDSFEPVWTVEVATPLRLQSDLPAESFPPLKANGTMSSRCDTLIFDAGSEEKLFASDRALFRDTAPRVPAGCAGSAVYLPELLGLGARGDSSLPELSPRLLVLYGSINPITRHQLPIAADEGFGHAHLTPQEKVLPDFSATMAGDVTLQALREQLREHPRSIIDNNDAGDNTETRNYAEDLGLSLDELRFHIVNVLGTVPAEFIEESAFDTSLLAGDDTLLQCMNAPGVWEVEPIGELKSGIALYRFPYRGEEHAVTTRSGGFEEEDLLSCLARFLERKTEGEKR